jgi:hypothetical protein
MKLFCGVVALACVPAALAANGNNLPYPKEKVAEFIVEKLDITTLPSALRPKHEKGKKTFADFGYVTSQLDENNAVIRSAPSGPQINIRVLDQRSAGIYVCIAGQTKDASPIQRVFLLKLKNANTLLKGRESFKEFGSCPDQGADSTSDSYGG